MTKIYSKYMKQLANMSKFILPGIICVATFISSCSDDFSYPVDYQGEIVYSNKVKMVLNANKPSYSDAATRASLSDWEDGSTIYINFQNNGSSILGMATYSSSTGLWEVSYGGSLPVTASGKCSLYYFENAEDLNTKGASIGGVTGIYEDLNGFFSFDGEKISISAKLSPKLGRVRFSGNKNDTIMLAGVKRYGYFDATNCTYKLDSTEVLLSATVQEGDKYYTPYYYGALLDGNKTLELTDMKDAFARYCSDIFKPGNSGYMKIPHSANFSGWMKNNPLSQSKVSINWPDSISEDRRQVIEKLIENMILVEGGEFNIGCQSNSSSGRNYSSFAHTDESPVHKVVLSPFYLSRTELTQREWKAVMNFLPKYNDGDNYPVRVFRDETNDDVILSFISFVDKLNLITGLNFTIPTEAEWEYAGYGGKYGSYKLFSGTKTYNTKYMDYTTQSPYCGIVASKLPNELRIYDMSGNVSELCYSIGQYTEKKTINPRWNKTDFVFRGGSTAEVYSYYCQPSGYFSINDKTPFSLANRTYYQTTNTYGKNVVGFRIALRLINY